MTGAVDGEEEIDRALFVRLAERSVEPLVPQDGRRPDLMLERLLDVLFGVRLDDEKAGLGGKEIS